MRDVFILGSTGSIGTQALEVIAQNPGRFCVRSLSAGGANLALLARQAARFRPEIVAISLDRGEEFATALAAELPGGEEYQPEILMGEDASARAAGSQPASGSPQWDYRRGGAGSYFGRLGKWGYLSAGK